MDIRSKAYFLIFFILSGTFGLALAQKPRPSKNNALKVNLTQLPVNELRLSYEFQLKSNHTLEFGGGYIYANRTLYDLEIDEIDDYILSSGFSVLGSYRYYPEQKKNKRLYPVQTYLSPVLFGTYTSYTGEWQSFESPGPGVEPECHRFDKTYYQAGFRGLFGLQNTQGRFLYDLYFGIGLKAIYEQKNTTAITTGRICEVNSNTTFPDTKGDDFRFTAMVNVGLKIGIRTSKAE